MTILHFCGNAFMGNCSHLNAWSLMITVGVVTMKKEKRPNGAQIHAWQGLESLM